MLPYWNLCVIMLTSGELHSHCLWWSDIVGHCLGYFFWLTLPFSLFFDIEFISGHSSSNMKLHRAILSYPAIIPAWLHSSSGLLWWWSSTEGVQARKTYICWRLALLSANIAVSLDLNEVRKRCPNQLPTASPVSSVYTNPTDLCSPFALECCFPFAFCYISWPKCLVGLLLLSMCIHWYM